jgi:HEXXH motif-containing protein
MNEIRDNDAEWDLTAERLRPVELGKHKALLAGIMRLAIQRAIPDRERALGIPYRLLSAAEALEPQAATSVLASPQFGAWANDALHCLLEDSPVMNGSPREISLGRLALFAATAAMRAGLPFEVAVPLSGGSASFPAVGVAHLGTASPWEWGRAWLDGAGCHVWSRSATVDVPVPCENATANWSPLLQVTVIEQGLCLQVVLDHSDPFLDRYGTAQRGIADPDLARWRHLIETGWQILARDHEALAALAAGAVRTVVPLIAPSPDRVIGGTEETSFGAIAMSLPADALGMAETLVHESHHAVLGALRDIEPLVRDEGHDQGRSFLGYAPWRDDPRPAHALLQGIYAHYGMGQFWRREYLEGAATHRERAAMAFGRIRAMTARGARSLGESGLLTEAGRKILAGIEDEVAQWRAEPLSTIVEQYVAELTRQHEARWRARWLARTWLRTRTGRTGSSTFCGCGRRESKRSRSAPSS